MILAFIRNSSLSTQQIFRKYQSTRYCGHVILLDILNIPPQSQLISEVEIVPEHDHLLLWKRLSEAIGDLIHSVDESDAQALCCNLFVYKIKIDLYMLGACMKYKVSR